MKYISNGKYDKNMTRTLEELADFFYDAMKFERITNKNIFRVLRYCEEKLYVIGLLTKYCRGFRKSAGKFLGIDNGKKLVYFCNAAR